VAALALTDPRHRVLWDPSPSDPQTEATYRCSFVVQRYRLYHTTGTESATIRPRCTLVECRLSSPDGHFISPCGPTPTQPSWVAADCVSPPLRKYIIKNIWVNETESHSHLAPERGGRQLAAKTHPIIHLASFVIPYPRFRKIFGYNIGCIENFTESNIFIDSLNCLGSPVIFRGWKPGCGNGWIPGIETGGEVMLH